MAIVLCAASNGNINITPNGTGSVVIDGLSWPQSDGTADYVLKTNGSGQLSWTAQTSGGGITDIVQDTTPQLGGNLDVNSYSIVSASNGNIAITPNGTGSIVLDGLNWPQSDGSADQILKTNGSGQLSWTTPNSGTVTSVSGTGTVNGISLSGTVTSTGSLTLSGTLDLSTPPAIGGTTAAAVSATSLTFKDPREAIYDLGTTGGTIAPNVSNGSVQKITLNSALTMNAFTSPVAGQSLTLIIYGGTAYTSITSTMKFAGGVKTLTGTASCIDILSVYYDGTTYFASLNKGFA